MMRAGAVEINCYVPITLRIVGVPTDDQLAAIGAALTRAVAARLNEAERVLVDTHGLRDGRHVEVREHYDPDRQGADGYAVPSYEDNGAPTAVPVQPAVTAPRPGRSGGRGSAPVQPGGTPAAPGRSGGPGGPGGPGGAGSTPATAAASRRTGLDVVTSSQQIEIDLHPEKFDPASGLPEPTPWREVEFLPGQTQIVYILTDGRSGEPLKVGKTTRDRFISRFGEYVAAGNKWGRPLRVTMFTMRRRSNKNVEEFEKEIRAGMERAGFRLPWDNTKRRLGRPGKGIPEPTTFQEELAVIDQVETAAAASGAPGAVPAEPSRAPAESTGRSAEPAPAAEQAQPAEPSEPALTAAPPTSTLPGRPPTPFVATPPSAGKRAVAGLGAAIAAANELLGSYNRATASSQTGIDLGHAEINFWRWAGADPIPGVWDARNKKRLPDTTVPEATAVGFQVRPYVVDIDIAALRHNLPAKIHNYDEFVYFLDSARELRTIEEFPPVPDRPNVVQRALAEHARTRYLVTVNKEDIPHQKVYDITDIMVPLRAAMLAQLDAQMRQRTEQLSAVQQQMIYRLRYGPETRVYRSQGGLFNEQPLISAQRGFGPDPWVLVVDPRATDGHAGQAKEPLGGGRVRVTPANADAGRNRVTTYEINRWIVDVEKEVKEYGRPILSRNEVNGVLESFVAGPQPGNPRFGNTRYHRHDDETSRRTIAVGELNEYWVDAADLEPVPDSQIQAYTNNGTVR